MTPLNSRLQLALLNRKRGRNALEKGFTLVELMIVIVIVGILSAVALPNFLSQTSKAKTTECKSQLAAQLKQISAEYVSSGDPLEAVSTVVDLDDDGDAVEASTAADAVAAPDVLSQSSNAGIFSYSTTTPDPTHKAIIVSCQAWTPASGVNAITASEYPDAKADAGLDGGGMFGCVNLENGQVKISKTLLASGTLVTADKEVSNSNGSEVCGTTAFDDQVKLLGT